VVLAVAVFFDTAKKINKTPQAKRQRRSDNSFSLLFDYNNYDVVKMYLAKRQLINYLI